MIEIFAWIFFGIFLAAASYAVFYSCDRSIEMLGFEMLLAVVDGVAGFVFAWRITGVLLGCGSFL